MSTGDSVDLGIRRFKLPKEIGQFTILGRLGSGAMGVVLDARMPGGTRVALKLIRPTADPERQLMLYARFLREARVLKQLDHPGVVRLIDFGEVDGLSYLAMERVAGVTLEPLSDQTDLSWEAVLEVAKQLVETIAQLHEADVVHRDIKPSNILITKEGRLVLTDFGVADQEEATGITQAGEIIGTAGFVPPECLKGKPHSTYSDQFAVGRLLFELAATAPPADVDGPLFIRFASLAEADWERFPEDDPWPELGEILRRMMMEHPEERYPSARACLAEIMAFGERRAEATSIDTLAELVERLGLEPHSPWQDAKITRRRPGEGSSGGVEVQPVRLGGDTCVDSLDAPSTADPASPPERSSADDPADRASEDDDALLPIAIARRHPPRSRADRRTDPSPASTPAPPSSRPPPLPSSVASKRSAAKDKADPGSGASLESKRSLSSSAAESPEPPTSDAGSPRAPSLVPVAEPSDDRDPLVAPSDTTSDFAADTEGLTGPGESPVATPNADGDPHAPERARSAALSPPGLEPLTLDPPAGQPESTLQVRGTFTGVTRPGPRHALILAVLLAITLSLVMSWVLLSRSTPRADPEPTATEPQFSFDGPPASTAEVVAARRLFEQGVQSLGARQLDEARRALGACVILADLPECHLQLSTVLSLTDDPAAAAHRARYVDTTTATPSR